MAKYAVSESPTFRSGKIPVASVQTSSAAIRIQLQLMPILIPRIVKSVIDELMESA